MKVGALDSTTQNSSFALKEVSPAGSNALDGAAEKGARNGAAPKTDRSGADTVNISPQAAQKSQDAQEKQQSDSMKRSEEKVKTHEAAHKAAGGQYAGAVTYQYETGPDGRSYVTGGEVKIDLSPGKTPQETITKMQVVIRAALAPSDPSGQDRAVAAEAAAIMAEAQRQLQADEGNPSDTAPSDEATTSQSPAGADLTPISTYA